MTTVLTSSCVLVDDDADPGWLAIEGDRIVDAGAGPGPRGAVDLGDLVVAPGFLDLQCNGLGTVDFATATPAQWRAARADLVAHGVTALCPTFVTAPLDHYEGMLAAAEAARSATADGEAALLGVHLEGPFLGGAPGAHDPTLVRPADVDWLGGLLASHSGLVRVVTLAPEADTGCRAIARLSAEGVTVAIGHSTCSYADARAAADAGATVVTHLFNGMSPLHHREPGLVGAALDDDRLTPTVIADLVHVHPAVLRLVFAASATVTVSDSVGSSGAPLEPDDAAWLADGTLAGAVTQLDGALSNLAGAGVPWRRAIASMTSAPARLLGCDDRGTLAPGAIADVVALDPSSLEVRRVWVRGSEALR